MIKKKTQISWKLRFYNMLIFIFPKQKMTWENKQTNKKKKKEFTSLGNASCDYLHPNKAL